MKFIFPFHGWNFIHVLEPAFRVSVLITRTLGRLLQLVCYFCNDTSSLKPDVKEISISFTEMNTSSHFQTFVYEQVLISYFNATKMSRHHVYTLLKKIFNWPFTLKLSSETLQNFTIKILPKRSSAVHGLIKTAVILEIQMGCKIIWSSKVPNTLA